MEDFERCSICTRTPLVGEGFTVVGGGRREQLVCDLCLAKPRAAALGEQLRRGRVKSAAGAANVQRIYPQPVRSPAARRRGATQPARAV
jgi:hypothetical protein